MTTQPNSNELTSLVMNGYIWFLLLVFAPIRSSCELTDAELLACESPDIEVSDNVRYSIASLSVQLNNTQADICCNHLYGTHLSDINSEAILSLRNTADDKLNQAEQRCWYGLYCDSSTWKWKYRNSVEIAGDSDLAQGPCTPSMCGVHYTTSSTVAGTEELACSNNARVSCIICGYSSTNPPTILSLTVSTDEPTMTPSTISSLPMNNAIPTGYPTPPPIAGVTTTPATRDMGDVGTENPGIGTTPTSSPSSFGGGGGYSGSPTAPSQLPTTSPNTFETIPVTTGSTTNTNTNSETRVTEEEAGVDIEIIGSGQFTDDYLEINIIFGVLFSGIDSTYDGYSYEYQLTIYPNVYQCKEIFDDETMKLLSENAQCKWLDDNSGIIVVLSGYSEITIDDGLVINDNVFKYELKIRYSSDSDKYEYEYYNYDYADADKTSTSDLSTRGLLGLNTADASTYDDADTDDVDADVVTDRGSFYYESEVNEIITIETISLPNNPIVPQPVMSDLVSVISFCDDLVVDARNSYNLGVCSLTLSCQNRFFFILFRFSCLFHFCFICFDLRLLLFFCVACFVAFVFGKLFHPSVS